MAYEQDVAAINCLAEEWHTKWAAADTDALAALFTTTPIVILRDESSVVLGMSELRTLLQSTFGERSAGRHDDAGGTGARIADDLEIVGDWASFQRDIALCPTPRPAGRGGDAPVSATFILRRAPRGGWRIASLLV